jgi:regulator of replication initiation timing
MREKMTTELEKPLQEIEQMRQENSELRKKLGIQVFEPNALYTQSGRSAVGSKTSTEGTQKPGPR